MQTTAIRKMELMNKISVIPEERLKEVRTFIDFVLAQSHKEILKPINLRGIWRNKGFEKITNLESELKEVRKEINDSILNRKF